MKRWSADTEPRGFAYGCPAYDWDAYDWDAYDWDASYSLRFSSSLSAS